MPPYASTSTPSPAFGRSTATSARRSVDAISFATSPVDPYFVAYATRMSVAIVSSFQSTPRCPTCDPQRHQDFSAHALPADTDSDRARLGDERSWHVSAD